MNISIREAFLAPKHLQEQYRPNSRFEVFNNVMDTLDEWNSIIKAYPEIWKKTRHPNYCPRLTRIDGENIIWFQVDNKTMARQEVNDLGMESNTYFYDTVTQSIIFNNAERPTNEMIELFPSIAEFIDSGKELEKLP